MNNISFSVLICTYNGENYIEEQINSILSQGVEYEDIIISDDGSTDNTLTIVHDVFSKHSVNYRVLEGPKSGVLQNFLNGIKNSSSDYLFISDQDDVWHKNRVKNFQKRFKKSTEPHLIYSDARVVDKDLKVISESFIQYQRLRPNIIDDDSILLTNCVQGASCAINFSLIKKVAELESNLLSKIIIHDWLFVLIAKYYGKIDFINIATIDYRQHNKNLIGAHRASYPRKLYSKIFNPIKHIQSAVLVIKQSYWIAPYLGVNLRKVSFKNVEPVKVILYRLGLFLKLDNYTKIK